MLTAQAAGDLDSHQGRTCGANAEAIANRALFIRPPLAKPYQASVPVSGLVPAYSQATVSDLPIVGKNFLQSTLSGSSFGSVSVPTVFSSTVLSLSIDAAEMDEFSFSASVLVVLGSFFGSASVSTVSTEASFANLLSRNMCAILARTGHRKSRVMGRTKSRATGCTRTTCWIGEAVAFLRQRVDRSLNWRAVGFYGLEC